MNDMRLPGIGFLSNELPNTNNADAPRDAAQDFDAVMSRFSNQRTQAPAPDQNADAPAKAANKAGRTQGRTPTTTNDRPAKVNGQPGANTKTQESDADCSEPATEIAATDPTALAAVVTEAAQLAAQNPAFAATANAVALPPADDETETVDSPADSVLDALAGEVSALAGRSGEKMPVDLRAQMAREENDDTHTAAGLSSKGRAPATAKDTLRFDVPLTRTLESTKADVAERFSAIASALAHATTHTSPAPAAETMSQAIAAAVAAHSGTTTYSIAHAAVATPIGAAGFANELAQRVVVFAGQRVQRAEIAVTPAELGPIAVSIEVRGQEATLAFVSSSHLTRAAIEDALPRLREMLSAQGLQLAGTHVGSEPRRDPYRPSRGEKNATGAAGDSTRDGVAAVSVSPGDAIRRRLNLIDIEV